MLRQALSQQAGWQAAPEAVFIARTHHAQASRRTQQHVHQHVHLAQQHAAVHDAALHLRPEERGLAHRTLAAITGGITGEFSAEDLLGDICSRFCNGLRPQQAVPCR